MTADLSDLEARAQRRRTQTRADQWQEFAQLTWRRGRDASDPAEARRWLERAHRLAPNDRLISLAYAGALLGSGEHEAAGTLFAEVAAQTGSPEALIGLGTSAHLLGDPARAALAVAAALRATVPGPTLSALADAIGGAWCGLTTDGVLQCSEPIGSACLDDVPLTVGQGQRRLVLPPEWRRAYLLHVEGVGGPMLGSPIPLRPFASVEGLAEARDGGVSGWAWCPADPGKAPLLVAEGPLGRRELRPTQPADGIALARPLAQPRAFALSADDVARLGEPVAVRGPDGRQLLGSPLEPGIEMRAAAGLDRARFAPVWADTIGPPPTPPKTRPAVAVVIPVHGGGGETLACLAAVLANTPSDVRVIVVDDASPDPELRAALDQWRPRIRLLRLAENVGFPGAANAGLRAAGRRDVVLLNSDTLVPPGWLPRLRAAAYSAPDVATATPFTNNGTILSYPDPAGGNPSPDLAAASALDRLAQTANARQVVEVPVGVGFCLYLRRAALDVAGPLREDLFAQGYGEENDFCLRARHHGFRHVAALDVFVAHAGAASFGDAREHLARRNGAILERLHPGYDALIARHVAGDPLLPARRRLDELRWAGPAPRETVILVTHGGGGGVERVVRERVAAIEAGGAMAAVLRPAPGGVRLQRSGVATPNLRFPMPDGLDDLVDLLRRDRPRRVELHHLLGHHHAIAELAQRLGAEPVSVVHDYARFCPRIALVGTERRYCGEPDVAGCEACIADVGSLLEDEPPVRELIARSMDELRRAARVVVPSADAAARLGRHFPGVSTGVEPWEDDAALPPLTPAAPSGRLRVVIVGAIGVEKGFEVLLACARDARARALPLDFTVVGFTADDERLLAAGPVFITGEYAEEEAVALIRAQRGHLAFVPSVWPETWCFALSRAWQAGLPAAVFDLGAPAERVRQARRGWVLPFGLPPRGVNDALLRLAPGNRE